MRTRVTRARPHFFQELDDAMTLAKATPLIAGGAVSAFDNFQT